jgi:hypothetical protein
LSALEQPTDKKKDLDIEYNSKVTGGITSCSFQQVSLLSEVSDFAVIFPSLSEVSDFAFICTSAFFIQMFNVLTSKNVIRRLNILVLCTCISIFQFHSKNISQLCCSSFYLQSSLNYLKANLYGSNLKVRSTGIFLEKFTQQKQEGAVHRNIG